jgi:WD40 repeat protein
MMNDDQISQFLDDPDFQAVLAECYQSLQRGVPIDQERIARQHPRFAKALMILIDDHVFLQQLAADLALPDRVNQLGPNDETIDSRSGGLESLPGDRIKYLGEYEVLREIARGGMGVVFAARQESLRRTVALKMILPGRLAGADDIDRFRREAEAAASLKHTNIVTVHEVGEHEGYHYFTMDLIDGRSLSEEIREESLPPRRAAELIGSVARAIHYAHEKGVLHRDLKPANVLLDRDGAPHVTDFGLAKQFRRATESQQPDLTVTGQILGTPSYMSPEQAAGKPDQVGPATDVYSLGAVLYATLTGRAPFVADTPVETLLQVVQNDPVPPRTLNPKIPRDLETICHKCLAKNPKSRYATALALAEDLDRWLTGRPILARPAGPIKRAWKWSRRHPAWTALMLVLLLAAGTTTWLWQLAKAASDLADAQLYVNRIALAERELQAQNRTRAMELLMQCESDRQGWEWNFVTRLCFATPHVSLPTKQQFVDQAKFDLSGKYLATSDTTRLRIWDGISLALLYEIDEPVKKFDFRPAANELAAVIGNEVKRVDLQSGKVGATLFRSREPIHQVTYDTTGKRLAILDMKHQLTVIEADSGETLTSFSVGEGSVGGYRIWLRFSADDAGRIAVVKHSVIPGLTGQKPYWIWDLSSQQIAETQPWQDGAPCPPGRVLDISPDGNRVAINGDGGAGITKILIHDRTTGKTVAFIPGLDGTGRVTAAKFDPTGESISIAVHEMNVGVEDVPGAKNDLTGFLGAMAVLAMKARPSKGMIYLHDVESGRQTQALRGMIGETSMEGLAFHRDGKRLVAAGGYRKEVRSADLTVIGELKLWNIDDAPEALVLRGHEHEVNRVAISPDGELFASGDTSGQVRIWRSTGQLIRVLQTSGGQSWRDKLSGVAFVDDGKQLVIADNQRLSWWDLATGRQLYPPTDSVDDDDENVGLSSEASAKNPQTRGYDTRILAMTASPSGKLLAYHTPRQAHVLRSDSREEIFSLEESVSRVVIDRDDKRVAMTYYHDLQGELKTFDLASGRQGIHVETEMIGSLFRTGYGLLNAAFSPDGKQVVGVGNNGPALVWDSRSGQIVHELTGHSGFIWAVAYCPDGSRIATGSTDGTIKLWDAASSREMITLRGHEGNVRDLAFSPDGKRLISVSNDMTVRIWNSDLEGEVKQLTPKAETGMPVDLTLDWNKPIDRDSRRQVLWGRDRMLALQVYEMTVRRWIADTIKTRYNPWTDSNWPNKDEIREDLRHGLDKQKEEVREAFDRDGEQVIPAEDLDREIDETFDRLFDEIYDKRFAEIQEDYKLRFEESRKRNRKSSIDRNRSDSYGVRAH